MSLPTVFSSMPRARVLALACAGASATLVGACYGERLPPPTFRFSCDDDDGCEDGERCIDELCQVPCTTATASEDCPTSAGYATCFNGVCSHVCQPDDDVCPEPQTCLSFDIVSDGGYAGGGFGGGSSELELGICGVPCESEDDCPEGEMCLSGACVPLEDGDDGDTADGTTGDSDTTGGATTDGTTGEETRS
jgi:hypothetical protein